jgi:hypothetical protein
MYPYSICMGEMRSVYKISVGSLNFDFLTLVSILITSVLKSTQYASISQISHPYPTCLPICRAVSNFSLEVKTKCNVSCGRKYEVLILNQLKFKTPY